MRFVKSLLFSFLAVVVCGRAGEIGDSSPFAELEKQHAGSRIGVAAFDLARNRGLEYHGQERFIMCSTFKVLAVAAVLKRVDEKKEKLDRFVPYGEAQLLEYAPVARAHVKEGGMTLEALCAAAIEMSDNTAANLVLDSIGGPQKVTEFARGLGDKFTRLDHNEPELNVARPGQDDDTTTPAAMCADLQRLLTSNYLTEASRTKLERWMQQNQTGSMMIRAGIPADWRIGDKTGRSGKGATNDIAILRPPSGGPVFVAIYTVDTGDSEEGRQRLVADVAKTALDALKE